MDYTIRERVEAEDVIKKSRFIAVGFPVHNEAGARDKILAMRKEFYDARHIAYAYRVNDGQVFQKSSDDGEPSGTAGKPILNFMVKENIINAIIFVVRYFGGVKLGAGGLTRAYSGTAVLLKPHLVPELSAVRFSCSLSNASRVLKLLDNAGITYTKTFGTDCEILAHTADADALRALLANAGSPVTVLTSKK